MHSTQESIVTNVLMATQTTQAVSTRVAFQTRATDVGVAPMDSVLATLDMLAVIVSHVLRGMWMFCLGTLLGVDLLCTTEFVSTTHAFRIHVVVMEVVQHRSCGTAVLFQAVVVSRVTLDRYEWLISCAL